MGSFSYTPDASFSEKLTLLMPVLMRSLCYSLPASFSLDEFLLRLLLLVLQWVSFTSLMMTVLAKSSSLDNWPESKTKNSRKTPINYPPKLARIPSPQHTQEYHHPARSTLCKFTNNNPFFTYCKVVSNCFLVFITWKTNSEPLDTDVYFSLASIRCRFYWIWR